MTQEEKRATLSSSKGKETGDGQVTHHLMLILLSPNGRFVTDATVHLSIKAPDGGFLEAAAAPMASGYGVDVDMRAKGTYEIDADVAVDGRRLADSFTYQRQ